MYYMKMYMGGSTKSQKAGRLKRLEAKIVKKPASYRDYVETKDYYTERTCTADFLTSLAEAICLMVSAVIFFKSSD